MRYVLTPYRLLIIVLFNLTDILLFPLNQLLTLPCWICIPSVNAHMTDITFSSLMIRMYASVSFYLHDFPFHTLTPFAGVLSPNMTGIYLRYLSKTTLELNTAIFVWLLHVLHLHFAGLSDDDYKSMSCQSVSWSFPGCRKLNQPAVIETIGRLYVTISFKDTLHFKLQQLTADVDPQK